MFNLSFLDLLSGALAAVIILFILVPKMSRQHAEAVETLERLEVTSSQLDSLMQLAQNAVPADLYAQIQERMEAMQRETAQLREEVEEMQRKLAECDETRAQLESTQAELRETQQQLSAAEARAEAAEAELERRQAAEGRGAKMFGIDAELGITCSWPEAADVDIWLKNSSTGEWCFYDDKMKDFARLQEDIQAATGDDKYELMYQEKLVPGSYELYVHLFGENAPAANVRGYIMLFPTTPRERKISFGPVRLTQGSAKPSEGGGKRIGRLMVTATSAELIQ